MGPSALPLANIASRTVINQPKMPGSRLAVGTLAVRSKGRTKEDGVSGSSSSSPSPPHHSNNEGEQGQNLTKLSHNERLCSELPLCIWLP